MPQGKGSSVQLVLIEESTYGTTPGTPSGYVIPVTAIGGDWYRRNLIENNTLRASRNPSAPVRGNVAVTGTFSHPMSLSALGWLLKHGVGNPVTSGAGPYTHVSKVNFNGASAGDLPTGLTLEIGFTDIGQYHAYDGCRISTLGFSVSSEGIAMVEVGIVGQGLTQGTSALDASPTSYTDEPLDHFAATMNEGGSSIAIVTESSVNLDNGLDTSQYVVGGSGEIATLPSGIAGVSGSITALFQDDALLTKGRAHTESSLDITWTSGTYSFTIDVPELVYEPAGPTINGPAGIVATMNYRGYYGDGADVSALVATLINNVTSY
jgi:hypothetical protein